MGPWGAQAWAHHGPMGGPRLGPSWAMMGPSSGPSLGPLWAHGGPKLPMGHDGPKLGPQGPRERVMKPRPHKAACNKNNSMLASTFMLCVVRCNSNHFFLSNSSNDASVESTMQFKLQAIGKRYSNFMRNGHVHQDEDIEKRNPQTVLTVWGS
jgi:hypothetical protein